MESPAAEVGMKRRRLLLISIEDEDGEVSTRESDGSEVPVAVETGPESKGIELLTGTPRPGLRGPQTA